MNPEALRNRMIRAVLLSAFVVFVLAFLLIGTIFQVTTANRLDGLTDLISRNGGTFPEKLQYEGMPASDQLFMFNFTEEMPYQVRYFTVFFDDDGTAKVSIDHIASVNAESAAQLATEVLAAGEVGYYEGHYRYRVADGGKMVVFLDCTEELENIASVLRIISLVELLFVFLVTLVFSLVSDRVVKPFEENARKQKQFITDASHELKTPVAIISANAEVLSYKDGESEWTRNIVEQTKRMSSLVEEMLMLSRLEEMDSEIEASPVDMSELVGKVADDFEEVFSSRSIEVERDIEDGIVINGNLGQLQRMCSVIVENASKYADEGGRVSITLAKGLKSTKLEVFNSCAVSADVDYEHLFDRFYRPDSSRASSSGGHGIGLSIAKRVAELHGGGIEAKPSDEGMTFIVTLSNRIRATAPATSREKSAHGTEAD